MNNKEDLTELWQDFLDLVEKYQNRMSGQAFGYAMIKYNTKLILDIAPTHAVAHETIKFATEEGIMWHVETLGRENG
jgi:hypothetical protein